MTLAACSTAAQLTPSPAVPSAVANVVDAKDFTFLPPVLTVAQGTTLQYINGDRSEHSITQGTDGVADADAAFNEVLVIGATLPITFGTAGEIHVTCRFHPAMNQIITVTGAPGAGGQPSAPATTIPASSAAASAPAGTSAPPASPGPSASPAPSSQAPGPYGSDEY